MAISDGADPRHVIEKCYQAWAAREIDGTLEQMADDCIYRLHVPIDVLPYGGVHLGKTAIAGCLATILDDYDFLAYAVDNLTVVGEIGRAQVVYYFRHLESGQQIDGRFRHVWRVRDGKVVEIDEFHDVPLLRAFVDMVRNLRS